MCIRDRSDDNRSHSLKLHGAAEAVGSPFSAGRTSDNKTQSGHDANEKAPISFQRVKLLLDQAPQVPVRHITSTDVSRLVHRTRSDNKMEPGSTDGKENAATVDVKTTSGRELETRRREDARFDDFLTAMMSDGSDVAETTVAKDEKYAALKALATGSDAPAQGEQVGDGSLQTSARAQSPGTSPLKPAGPSELARPSHKSSESAKPATPAKLATPVKSAKSGKPAETDKPAKPDKPAKSDKSTKPAQAEMSAEPKKGETKVKEYTASGRGHRLRRSPNIAPRDVADKKKSKGIQRLEVSSQDGQHKSLTVVMASAQNDPSIVAASSKKGTPPVAADISTVDPATLSVTALDIEQPPVPGLQYGLDRVLFNSGVYQLQDPHSRVYNFDPYLQKIMPVAEFDYNMLKEYKTSSRDTTLSTLARSHGKKYVGSTSSMTSTLGHFHYLLSNFRNINTAMLSKSSSFRLVDFTRINRAPNAIFLRYKPESETYAIDADKEYDSANVLMMLGKSMEKLLTLPTGDFERYRKSSSDESKITAEEKDEPESFQYTTMGDFLMRSQLDAYDPRLPGTGMFDLKTRAVVSIRMQTGGFEEMLGYEIQTLHGLWMSYEREYYDMLRSTMLKYMLQARMGRMDGIFVAYHNIERIFGFQYLPIHEIDRAMHGQVDPTLGDREFRVSLKMMNEVLEMATAQFPGRSMRLHFETMQEGEEKDKNSMMWIFAEPMEEEEIDRIQDTGKEKIQEFERTMMGMAAPPPTEPSAAQENTTKPDESEPAASVEPSDTPSAPASDDTSPAETYTSSDTPADPAFLSHLARQSAEMHDKPLFAARIIVMNKVNGTPCPENRPVDLTASDKWEVDYLIREAKDLNASAKWANYEDCKTRRRELFKQADEEGEQDEEGKNAARVFDQYLSFLRDLSAQGRVFREKLDESDSGRETVVVGLSLIHI